MEHDPDELENFVKERYERRQDRDMDEGDVSAIGQQSLLPTIRDTKLWVMQCRPGMEREIAICMMQKFWNMMDRRQPLPIKSVFFQDHLKGYIYIEADKESHVKESMGGMRGILFSKGVKLVPIAEMVDAVTVNTKAKQVHVADQLRCTTTPPAALRARCLSAVTRTNCQVFSAPREPPCKLPRPLAPQICADALKRLLLHSKSTWTRGSGSSLAFTRGTSHGLWMWTSPPGGAP